MEESELNNESYWRVSAYRMFLDRIPGVPCCWGGDRLNLIGSPVSSSGLGSSSRLGSLWVEVSFLRTQGSGQLMSSWGLFERRGSSGDCGLCSMVSCSGLLVSWITKFISRKKDMMLKCGDDSFSCLIYSMLFMWTPGGVSTSFLIVVVI